MRPPAKALVNRVVLAVHRQDLDAAAPRRVGHEPARHHEDFLVRERDRLAGLDGREDGLEGRGPGRGAEHDVGIRMRGHRHQALGPGTEGRDTRSDCVGPHGLERLG